MVTSRTVGSVPERTKGQGSRAHIHLTLPTELAARIRAMAERDRRPLTAHIQLLLERALSNLVG